MTAKEAFRLADSIMRYEVFIEYPDNDNYVRRDTLAETATIPNEFIGAAYRARAIMWAHNTYWENLTGRIIGMYEDKLHDAKMLAKGWHVQRPNGYGIVGGQMALKRIKPPQVRMT